MLRIRRRAYQGVCIYAINVLPDVWIGGTTLDPVRLRAKLTRDILYVESVAFNPDDALRHAAALVRDMNESLRKAYAKPNAV